ncbi:hypothetical protein M1L60_02065 [Actinoplanes sp. TRM 88003]|uniref:Uncharacterized protein n=1 Tax=Paractinoplanes aksuensis TaxID=2939490 RepID=A0ABT1DEW7_9ACTN|nr:hypothetical protein [Actinoplanes aksuensis]MCO8269371.1 hypothetical protein [Actinoplanes aksuensis]
MDNDEKSDDQERAARRTRFGRLPERVLPTDLDETVDTRTVQDRPATAMNPSQVAALFDGA